MSQFSGSTMGRYSRLWLMITGVFMLGLGLVFILFLGSVPYAGGAMIATGGILAAVGIALIVIGYIVGRRAGATDQLLATGTAGSASITGLTQTGVYLNENPQVRMQLLVSLPGQTPYATSHTEIVPLILLGRLSSGAPLAVRVDPMNLNRVAVDWSAAPVMPALAGMPGATPMTGSGIDENLSQIQAALAQSGSAAAAPFASAAQGNYTVEQLRAWLRQNGVEASARIDMLQDSGKVVGDERLYTMEMTLTTPSGSQQKQPASAAMVPLTASHKLFQGMSVPVRYAAENPNMLMVEWDKI